MERWRFQVIFGGGLNNRAAACGSEFMSVNLDAADDIFQPSWEWVSARASPAVPLAPVPTPNEFTCAFESVVNPPAGPVGPVGPVGPWANGHFFPGVSLRLFAVDQGTQGRPGRPRNQGPLPPWTPGTKEPQEPQEPPGAPGAPRSPRSQRSPPGAKGAPREPPRSPQETPGDI